MRDRGPAPLGLVAIAALLLPGPRIYALNALEMGSTEGPAASVPVTLRCDAPVQGFVLAVAYDTARATVTNVTVDGTATRLYGADFVQPEVLEEEGGFTLAVVMDSTGTTGNAIPAGAWDIARIEIAADAPPACGEDPAAVPLRFVDGKLNTPKLYNVIVIAGRSIRASEGLVLRDGLFTIPPVCARLRIEDTTARGGPDVVGHVPVMADNPLPLQGFVLSIAHGPEVELREISIEGTDTEAAGAEFHAATIEPSGGTLGVVVDFEPPYEGRVIPPAGGGGTHLATFSYALKDFTCPSDTPEATVRAPLRFVDGVFGDPPLENVLVEAGRSVRPELVDGTLAFEVFCAPITFFAGARAEVGDGIVAARGTPDDRARIGLFYASENAQLQGLSMALCFDYRLTVDPDSFSIEDTITEALGAEFVNWHVDDDPGDGDPKEMIVGILLDVVPPFEDQRYPPTPDGRPLQIAHFEVDVAPFAPCDACLPVEFCDGADGAGTVPIWNRAVVGSLSVPPSLRDGAVCLAARPVFLRGDCNFDGEVDLADPAAAIAHVFTGTFTTPCEDGCDANDDGHIDLADSVVVLAYLFREGAPPPPPGPAQPGVDPTRDGLGCEAGAVCP